MRPLTKPDPPADLSSDVVTLAVALGDAVGRFCSFCEKALNYRLTLFDKRSGVVAPTAAVGASDWPWLLLICGDCAAAAATSDADKLTERHVWPDEAWGHERVFEYKLFPSVLVERYDADETMVVESEADGDVIGSQPLVLIRVRTESLEQEMAAAALNTLALFRLNGPFFKGDYAAPRLRVPDVALVIPQDLRLEQRYDAYLRGVEAGAALASAKPTVGISGRGYVDNLLKMIRLATDGFGYMSTWRLGIVDELARKGPDMVQWFEGLSNPPVALPKATSPAGQSTLGKRRLADEVRDNSKYEPRRTKR